MFALPAATISTKHRAAPAHFLSEVIATLGLLLVIFALARSGRSRAAPAAVGAYIGAAYSFTSSTSFANPAITIGQMFSGTFAGITPLSVPSFIAAQVGGRRRHHRPPPQPARPGSARRRTAVRGPAACSGPAPLTRQPDRSLPCTWS